MAQRSFISLIHCFKQEKDVCNAMGLIQSERSRYNSDSVRKYRILRNTVAARLDGLGDIRIGSVAGGSADGVGTDQQDICTGKLECIAGWTDDCGFRSAGRTYCHCVG